MSNRPSGTASKTGSAAKTDGSQKNSKSDLKNSASKTSNANSKKSSKSYVCCKEQSEVSIGTECDCYEPEDIKDETYFTKNEFIYGGPWIVENREDPFIDAITPMNLPLQGMFKR